MKEDNEKNVYNQVDETFRYALAVTIILAQNFSGVYCECSRPYPDPEDPVDDCMVQVWFCRGEHIVEVVVLF